MARRAITICSLGEQILDVPLAQRDAEIQPNDLADQGWREAVLRSGVSVESSVLVWSRHERDQAVHLHAGGTLTLDPGPSVSPKAEALLPSPP